MRRRFVSSLACAIVILLGTLDATDAWAQGFTGGQRGAVRDANGVIPGVQVILTNEGTNISRTTVTNEVGEYAFVAVLPGVYSVRATLEGYKTFERKGLTIGTQQFITLDILLEVGGITEEVVVVGGVSGVETSNASVSTVLDKATLNALPTLNRNPFMLASSMPTVRQAGDPIMTRMQDQSNVGRITLAGGVQGGNNYLIDGVAITDLGNRPVVSPTMEALDDVKVQVHTYDAEVGRTGGGVFNATARSGTNKFHGSGVFQYRPEWGMANYFFNKRAGISLPEGLFSHKYLGSFGGPIVHNKTFFWIATEGYRDQITRNGQLILPTDRERNGDFSQTFDRNGNLVVINDPLTTRPNPSGTGFIRDPFPGNIIPADRINPVAKNVTNFVPHAQQQRSGADGAANYISTSKVRNLGDMLTAKVEHKLTNKWTINGLYVYNRTNEPRDVFWDVNQQLDAGADVVKRRPRVLTLNGMYIPNSTTVVSLRYGWTTYPDITYPSDVGFDLASLGFPASFVKSVTVQKFPLFVLQDKGEIQRRLGTAFIGGSGAGGSTQKSWGMNGSVSKLIARHTLKGGFDFRNLSLKTASLGAASGTFNFDRGWTQGDPAAATKTNSGDSFASLLLGVPTANASLPSSVPINVVLQGFVRYYGGYLQDDWRISSKLTMNYGLRYEWEPGLREIEDRDLVAFDRTVVSPLAAKTGLDLHGGLRYAGQDGFPKTQGNPSKKKFAPRVGVAWSLNHKTSVRGGYGLFWVPFNYASIAGLGFSQPTFSNQSNNLIPTTTLSNPFPNGLLQPPGSSQGLLTGVGSAVTFNSQDRQSPYVQQYSVDLQRELPGNMVATISYIGTRGDQLDYGTININQLRPDVVAQWGSKLNDQLPNPFSGIAEAGAFSTSSTISRAQLLRPFPQFGNIQQAQTTGGRTRYSAVIVKLDKRLSGWLAGQFHYTWSRLNSDLYSEICYYSVDRQSRPLDSYNPAGEYSRSLLDQPHRLVLSPIVRLPFGAGQKWGTHGLADALVGGWSVALVATVYESGFPINVTQSSDNTGSFSGQQRPNWTSVDPSTPGSTTDRLNNYINPAAYASAPAFTFGTGKRTDARNRTPSMSNYDLAVSKDTKVFAGLKGQIRFEILNLSNSVIWEAGPESRLGQSAFGAITKQGGNVRLLQIMFRLFW